VLSCGTPQFFQCVEITIELVSIAGPMRARCVAAVRDCRRCIAKESRLASWRDDGVVRTGEPEEALRQNRICVVSELLFDEIA